MDRKQTVLANSRAEIALTTAFREFLTRYRDDPNAWFVRDGGDTFLGELGGDWNSIFTEYLESFFLSYFERLGIEVQNRINVEPTDSRRGSWIMEAALTMFGTVGTAYQVLKGVGELPKIADGIEETKSRVQHGLETAFGRKMLERIEPYIEQAKPSMRDIPGVSQLQLIPPAPLSVSFSIDSRPLRGLTPDKIHSHSIHLAVGVSRSALSIENLGESQLVNLRSGLFKSDKEMNHWSFSDAYSKSVPTLNQKQTISLAINEFHKYGTSTGLELDENAPLHVDCWIQDNSGIYLFNFLVE